MKRNENLYITESSKSVKEFVTDFSEIVKKYAFVVNNSDTMDMNKTFTKHGGSVADNFDLHMMQVCKPTKVEKSLTANVERAILIPKFVMIFSKDGKTQIRYLSYNAADISELVPDDPEFPESLARTFAKIRSMIDEAK